MTQITTTTQHPAVIWLRDKLLPSLGGNLSAAHRETGISHKTLKGLLEGTYSGNVDRQLAKLEEQRERLTARPASTVDLRCIPTSTMMRIHAAADAAKIAGMMNLVAGKSQIGKTTAAVAYQRRYPETTILLRMPTRPTCSSVIRALATAAGLNIKHVSNESTLNQLKATLSHRHLIIVDEAHAALATRIGLDALDTIRELHDVSGCAVLMLVTDIGAREIDRGSSAERLTQLVRRGERDTLDATPSVKDVMAIVSAYGLTEPSAENKQLLTAMARSSCFGQICHRLRYAYVEASRRGEALTWALFQEVHNRMTTV